MNANSTVVGDAHNGFASLTFDTVQATGLRIGFSAVGGGACGSDPNNPCNHYRVGEFEAHYDPPAAPGPAPVAPGGSTGVRIMPIEGQDARARQVRAGPAVVTAPSRLSLRSLRSSKCLRVLVTSAKPARVLVTIFSGRRSVRLLGQRLVTFARAGRAVTCILVPRRARTFNVRTPLSFAVGYALGARARSGQRAARPVIRPIALVP